MKNRYKMLLILSFLFYKGLFAQIQNEKEYVVVTFEMSKNKVHRMLSYYWIIPVDSINSEKILPIYSLYLYPYFDKSELEECCRGGVINVLESNGNDTVSFNNEYHISLKQLNELVFINRKKIQTIKHNWYNPKFEETVQIYITPITGDFCYCMQKFSSLIKNYFQEGVVLLPLFNFKYNSNFWKTKMQTKIEYFDFYDFKYVNTH
jgi:hypothetical protein